MTARPFFALGLGGLWSTTALAQSNPTLFEPTLGEKLGGWLPFILVFIIAVIIFQYRKRTRP